MKKKINNNNLILSAALNYKWNDLKIFVKSLRKFSNDRVILIVKDYLDQETKNRLKEYNIETKSFDEEYLKKNFQIKNIKYDIAQRRYSIYYSILTKLKKKPKKILLSDCRDVVFQSNIFLIKFKYPLNFFLEEEKILNDNRNSRWLLRTVGNENFNKIKNNFISCSGTTLGNFNEIINYSKLMKKYIELFPYKKPFRHKIILKKMDTGYDQGIHNYLIHNEFFKKKKFHDNLSGNICTTAYMKKFRFNKKNQLINRRNKVFSIIHQYDRCINKNGKMIFKFEKIYD